MAALSASAINRLDQAYPQIPAGVWSWIPVEVAWGANNSGDTATIVVPGKVKGVIGGAFNVAITQSAQSASIVLTSKAASLGTHIVLLLMEVGR